MKILNKVLKCNLEELKLVLTFINNNLEILDINVINMSLGYKEHIKEIYEILKNLYEKKFLLLQHLIINMKIVILRDTKK